MIKFLDVTGGAVREHAHNLDKVPLSIAVTFIPVTLHYIPCSIATNCMCYRQGRKESFSLDFLFQQHRFLETVCSLDVQAIWSLILTVNEDFVNINILNYTLSRKTIHVQNDSYSLVVSAVRLVGGKTEYEGRVEIYHLGEWGTVCGIFWDIRDATVVCRQLGYSRAVSAKSGAHYGEGSGNIWMNDVSCRGDETSLHFCPFSDGRNTFCDHSQDVGVICGKTMYVNVANANIRKNETSLQLVYVLHVDWCLRR